MEHACRDCLRDALSYCEYPFAAMEHVALRMKYDVFRWRRRFVPWKTSPSEEDDHDSSDKRRNFRRENEISVQRRARQSANRMAGEIGSHDDHVACGMARSVAG